MHDRRPLPRHPRVAPPTPRKAAASKTARASGRPAVVAAARAIAARGKPRDCSSFVLAAYARAGRPIRAKAGRGGSVADGLYASLRAASKTFRNGPAPGDLAFFRDTFGEMRGRITHVALVAAVAADGSVLLLDRLNSGVQESRLDLRAPHDPHRNSYLRRKRGHEPVLAGELFVAFARP